MASALSKQQLEPSNILQRGLQQLPFQASLSLVPLIRYWEEALKKGNEIDGLLALRVLEQIALAPELKHPITDISTLDKHKDLVELLMTALLPPAMRDKRISAAISPVNFELVYTTRQFEALMQNHDGVMRMYALHESNSIIHNKHLWPCSFILDKCYGLNIINEISIIFHLSEKENGMNRYFKPELNTRFSEIVNCKAHKKLSDSQLSQLLNELENEDLWMKHFTPERFEFNGFVWLDLIEITESEILSRLKYALLEREAFLSQINRRKIRQKLSSLFRIPDLKVGLIPYQKHHNSLLKHGYQLWHSLLNHPEKYIDKLEYSIYSKAIIEHQAVIIDDLGQLTERTDVENALLFRGIRNLVIAPLITPRGLVGLLELGSPRPCELTALSTIKLRDVLPIFAVAMERSLNERENQVQALIKEKCTAIHPSVGWRFYQAGLKLLEEKEQGKVSEMEPIVFKKVYPLFGLVDVRNSSLARNNSIQADFIQQLSLAQQVIQQTSQHISSHQALNTKIHAYKNKIEEGIHTGYEADILAFIKDEINPVFEDLSHQDYESQKLVDMYRSALDHEFGIVNKRRKGYEESIGMLNEALSNHIAKAQTEAQQIFPHYFAKSQTDGVEYNMYMGASIAPDQEFSLDHLKYLRLWQLKLTCEMARIAAQIKPQLPIPMDVAQLILVYNAPLSIKFKFDEKQFDVDGAYNLRYEIIKKRIDKAVVKDKKERLTQPGTIAIVYAQESDIKDYHHFIAYLQRLGYLQQEIERLEVKPMLGVKGLKALRIPLNLYTHVDCPDLSLDLIADILCNLG